jgi:Tripartite tricarboxylate transporter TctB family
MNNPSAMMSFVMLAIFIVMTGVALVFFPEGARFQPLVIGLPAIALSLLQLTLDLRAKKAARARDASSPRLPSAAETVDAAPSPAREQRMWLWFIAFIAGVLLLGFWITIPLFLIGFLRVEANAPWLNAITFGMIAAGLLYAVFGLLLRTSLHEGFLVQWIRG